MAIAKLNSNTVDNNAGPAPTLDASSITVTSGSLLVAVISMMGNTSPTVSDDRNGSWGAADVNSAANGISGYETWIFSKANAAAGATVITMTQGSGLYAAMTVFEFGGAATSSHVDTSGNANATGDAPPTVALTTGTNNCCIVAGGAIYTGSGSTVTEGTNFTEEVERDLAAPDGEHYVEYWLDSSTAGSKSAFYTPSAGFSAKCTIAAVAYKIGGGGAASLTPVVGAGTLTGVAGRMGLGISPLSTRKGT